MSGVPEMAYLALQAVLGLAMLLASIRIARGPTLADRVVAFDVLAMAVFAMIVSHAMRTGVAALLDAALVLALLAFLATVAAARFLETRTEAPRRKV